MRRLAVVAAVVVAVLLAAVVGLFGPYFQDDWRLDRVVRAVALDWRDFGRDAAWTRLQHELDRQAIGLQVADDDCTLLEVDDERVVRCTWTAEVAVPLLAWRIPLQFSSDARLTAEGDLR